MKISFSPTKRDLKFTKQERTNKSQHTNTRILNATFFFKIQKHQIFIAALTKKQTKKNHENSISTLFAVM